jgi:hypothetical protein
MFGGFKQYKAAADISCQHKAPQVQCYHDAMGQQVKELL